jgi:hypothetical protein
MMIAECASWTTPFKGPAELASCRLGMRDYRKATEESSWDFADCPCRGTATLYRASNGVDASLYEYRVSTCPHYLTVDQAIGDLDHLIPKDELDRFERDLDRPGGSKQLPEHHLVNATHVYGDRTVELTWTRDVHRRPDGTLQVQDTETYFIAVRPKKAGDRERVDLDVEPVITGAQKCPWTWSDFGQRRSHDVR